VRIDPVTLLEEEGEQRPIALLRSGGRYEAFDPRQGVRQRVDAGLAARLQSEAVTFSRPLPGGVLSLKDMGRFALTGRVRDLTLVLFVGVAATLLGMLVPIGTARIMDHAIPDADGRLLLEIGLGLGAAVLGQALYRLSEGVVLLRVGVGSEAETQAALWDRLLRLRPSFFRRFSSGDLQSRVMAVDDVGRDITGNVMTTLFSSFLSLLNLGLLWYYSRSLALLAVGIAVVVVAATLGFGFGLRQYLRRFLELDGRFFGMEVQLIQAVGKLRVAGAEARAFTHWLTTYTKQLRLLARTLWLSDASRVFNVLVGPVSTVLLFLSALALLRSSQAGAGTPALTLGTFLAFNAAFGTFLSGVTALSATNSTTTTSPQRKRRLAAMFFRRLVILFIMLSLLQLGPALKRQEQVPFHVLQEGQAALARAPAPGCQGHRQHRFAGPAAYPGGWVEGQLGNHKAFHQARIVLHFQLFRIGIFLGDRPLSVHVPEAGFLAAHIFVRRKCIQLQAEIALRDHVAALGLGLGFQHKALHEDAFVHFYQCGWLNDLGLGQRPDHLVKFGDRLLGQRRTGDQDHRQHQHQQ